VVAGGPLPNQNRSNVQPGMYHCLSTISLALKYLHPAVVDHVELWALVHALFQEHGDNVYIQLAPSCDSDLPSRLINTDIDNNGRQATTPTPINL
jgi:hypothetical protein